MPPIFFFAPLFVGLLGAIGADIASAILVAAIDVGLAIGFSALAQWLAPKPGLRGSTLQVSINANDPRRILIGRVATGGSLVTFQGYGTNNEFIIMLFRVADHKCQGLAPAISLTGNVTAGSNVITGCSSTAGLRVGDPISSTLANVLQPTGAVPAIWIVAIIPGSNEIILSDEAVGTHSGATLIACASAYFGGVPITINPSTGAVSEFFTGGEDNCWITFFDGDWNQAACPDMVANSGGRWTTDDRGRGVAYVELRCKANNTVFPGGLTDLFQFTYVIDGMPLYDPRLDGSVGGSGGERQDDQGTWAFYTGPVNAALVAYNLLQGIRVEDTSAPVGSRVVDLFYGLGLPASVLPFTENTAAMNVCDQTISLNAGGTEPLYTVGGVATCDQTMETILGDMLAAMAGKLMSGVGRYVLLPGQAQTSVRTFEDTDILLNGPFSYTQDIDLDTIANAVTGQFIDPASMYSAQPLPPRVSLTDEVTDGGYKAVTVDLSFVTSNTQGQRCQEIARQRGRRQKTAQITVAPENLDLEAGDWITWTSARFGWTTVWEIVQTTPKATDNDADTLQVVLSLTEIDSAVFAWTPSTDELSRFDPTFLASASIAQPPAPAPGSWVLAVATITDSSGGTTLQLTITGAVDNPLAELIIWDISANGGSTWQSEGTSPPSTTIKRISGLAPGVTYLAEVSYLVNGVESLPLILGGVVAGSTQISDGFANQGALAVLNSAGTSNIVANAVTNPLSAITASSQTVGTSFVTLQTLSITTTGGVVQVMGSFALVSAGASAEITIQMYRDATLIYSATPGNVGAQLATMVCNDSPSAGAHTYTLQAAMASSSEVVDQAVILLTELKR